jgi:hypothetical protein
MNTVMEGESLANVKVGCKKLIGPVECITGGEGGI